MLNRLYSVTAVAACILFSPLCRGAAPEQSPSFITLYDFGLHNSPSLQLAHERVEGEEQAYLSARSELLPRLDYVYSHARNGARLEDDRYPGVSSQVDYEGATSSFSLLQPIVDLPARYRSLQAKVRIEGSRLDVLAATQKYTFDYATAYFSVASTDAEIRLQASHRERLVEAERRVLRMMELGEASLVEVTEVQSELALAEIREAEAETLHDEAKQKLSLVIGTSDLPKQISPIHGLKGLFAGEAIPLERWIGAMRERNPELGSLREKVRVAEMSLKEQSARTAPTVSFVARKVASSSSDARRVGETTDTASVGVEVRIPIFSGGGVLAERRRALHLRTESEIALDSREREVMSELSIAYGDVEKANSRLKSAAAFLASAEARVRATLAGVHAGERNLVDALASETQQTQAQRELVRQVERSVRAWLRIRLAAGTLEREDVLAMDRYMAVQP